MSTKLNFLFLFGLLVLFCIKDIQAAGNSSDDPQVEDDDDEEGVDDEGVDDEDEGVDNEGDDQKKGTQKEGNKDADQESKSSAEEEEKPKKSKKPVSEKIKEEPKSSSTKKVAPKQKVTPKQNVTQTKSDKGSGSAKKPSKKEEKKIETEETVESEGSEGTEEEEEDEVPKKNQSKKQGSNVGKSKKSEKTVDLQSFLGNLSKPKAGQVEEKLKALRDALPALAPLYEVANTFFVLTVAFENAANEAEVTVGDVVDGTGKVIGHISDAVVESLQSGTNFLSAIFGPIPGVNQILGVFNAVTNGINNGLKTGFKVTATGIHNDAKKNKQITKDQADLGFQRLVPDIVKGVGGFLGIQ